MTAAHTEPTPTGQLDDRDRREIARLADLSNKEFDASVNAWANGPDAGGSAERVYFSGTLHPRTFEASGRLITGIERRRRTAKPDAARDLDALYQRLVQIRARGRAIRDAIQQREAAEALAASPRQRAYRLLAELHRRDFSAIRRALADGADEKALLAEMRAKQQAS